MRNPLSRELPDWLDLCLEWRLREEARGAELFNADDDDDFGSSRLRVSLAGKPSPNVRFYVEGQDSRIGWREPDRGATENPLDLRQAWVEVGGEEAGPARLRVGRQVMRLGGQRLFGERRWSNIGPTWDAVRLTVRRGQDAVDVLSMSMTDPGPGFDRPFPAAGPGSVHGVYGSLGSLLPRATVEPYVFFVARPRNGPEPDLGPEAGAWSGGLRIAGRAGTGWQYEAEWTQQRGHARATALRGAMGAVQLSYGAPTWPWEARLHAEHEYASGDRNPGDGRITTYDNLFAGRRLHLGMINLIGRRNIRAWETGIETRPAGAVRLRLDAHGFWVASRLDALYGPDGAPAVAAPAGGAVNARAGEEIDLTLLWTPAPYCQLDAGAMRFFSGPFVRQSRGKSAAGTLLFVAMTLRL